MDVTFATEDKCRRLIGSHNNSNYKQNNNVYIEPQKLNPSILYYTISYKTLNI